MDFCQFYLIPSKISFTGSVAIHANQEEKVQVEWFQMAIDSWL